MYDTFLKDIFYLSSRLIIYSPSPATASVSSSRWSTSSSRFVRHFLFLFDIIKFKIYFILPYILNLDGPAAGDIP